jgi:hypothetical protein
MYKSNFSTKEVALFEALGFNDLLEASVEPVTLYEIAAREAFLKGAEGKEVQSLRRCLRAIQEGSPYRMTQEFDSLIELSELSDFPSDSWENVMYHLVNFIGGDGPSLCKWMNLPPKPIETALQIISIIAYHEQFPDDSLEKSFLSHLNAGSELVNE